MKNKAILGDVLQTWKLIAELTASYQCVLRSFQSICLNYCACPEKVMPGHTKCCTCHAKSSQQTWGSDAPKCNPSQEISARTSSQIWWTCLLYCTCHCTAPAMEMLQNPHVLLTFDMVHNPLRLPCETTSERPKVVRTPGVFNILTFWLRNVLRATTACTCWTSQLPKVVRAWCVLYILTSKCASRHNGVRLFDISTSKSGPSMVCFVHFDFEMCFAPQRRALFRHLNFQKCSGPEVFLAFSLANVLRATTACNFSSLIWPAGSAPAALASLLFDPPEPQIIGQTQCFATFLPFRAFFLLTLSLLWSSLFYSSLLSDSSRLCFFICPYCRKFDF